MESTVHHSKHALGANIQLCFKRGPGRGVLEERYKPTLTSWVAPATQLSFSERRMRKSSLSKDAPEFLPLFAFPRGIQLQLQHNKTQLPRDTQFVSFVLTNEHGGARERASGNGVVWVVRGGVIATLQQH